MYFRKDVTYVNSINMIENDRITKKSGSLQKNLRLGFFFPRKLVPINHIVLIVFFVLYRN